MARTRRHLRAHTMPRYRTRQAHTGGALVGGVVATLLVSVLIGLGLNTNAALVTVVVALITAVVVIVVVRDIEAVLHVLVLSVFVEGVSVGPTSVGRILAVVALMAVVGRFVFSEWRPAALPPRAWLPTVLFIAWVWASGFWAQDIGAWFGGVGQIGLAVSFFAAFAFFVRDTAQVHALLRTFVIGSLVVAAIGVVQSFGGDRAVGLQGDGNLYAVYQVAAVPAAITLGRVSRSRYRLWWFVAVVPLVGSVLASDSRGALLATVLVLAFSMYPIIRNRTDKRRRLAAALATVLIVIAIAASGTAFNDRLDPATIASDRASGRLDLWLVAWNTAQDHPELGLGAGNFKDQSVERLRTQPGVQLPNSHHLFKLDTIEVHNIYLETLVDYGVVGFLLFVSVIVGAALGIRTGVRKIGRGTALDALGPMLVAYCATAFFLSVVNSKLLWMLVGMAAAFQAVPRRHVHLSDERTLL